MPGDCVYVLVSFKDYGINATQERPKPIKLSGSYLYDINPSTTSHERLYVDGWEIQLGRCSANYCGNYRFKEKDNRTVYLEEPPFIQLVRERVRNYNGLIDCFLNLDRPEDGAYYKLNDVVNVPENRIFRWYEGWIILSGALALSFALIIYMLVMFYKARHMPKVAQPAVKPFEPPGLFTPIRAMPAHQSSTCNSSTQAENEEIEKLNRV
ncbi:uncharacterized protein [Watersipora subatra]